MKRFFLRAALFLLTLLLFISSLPVLAETTGDIVLSLSFRDADKIETAWTVTYSDSYFTLSPDTYDHALGQLSVSMAICAWRDARKEIPDKDDNIISFLEQAGFSDIETPGYDEAPTTDSISNAIAHRTLPDGTTLIAVAVCGGGYGAEWASNLYVGDEEMSAGFHSAALIVEERIRDYISRYDIQGEKCLWISGYSRAAAVSNITAADMTSSGIFSRVYGYTFATPRTTRTPGNYTNIFNIVGRFDPVPSVPLPDWGYQRYGIDLYTPAQETNSDYADAAYRVQNWLDSIGRGTHFRNNVGMNNELHTILEFLLDILPDSATYNGTLYPILSGVWTEADIENIIPLLSTALTTLLQNGTIQGVNITEFLQYLSEIGYEHTAGGNQEQLATGGWDPDAILADNLLHEHMGTTYLGWMMSTDDPEELFLNNTTYTRFIIRGKVNIDVFDENGFCVGATSSGKILRDPVDESEAYYGDDQPELYCYSSDGSTVICLPGDAFYMIRLKAKDSDVDGVTYFGITYTPDRLSGSVSETSTLDVKKGEEYWIVCDTEQDGTSMIGGDADYTAESIAEGAYNPRLLLSLQRGNVFKMDLQTLVLIALAAVVVAVFLLIICLILGLIRLIRHKKRRGGAALAFHALVVLLCFSLEEFCRFYVSGYPIAMSILKGLASFTILLLAVKGIRRKKRTTDLFVCGALLLNGVADVMINQNMLLAMALYGVSHAFIATGFILNKKPAWWQYVVCAALVALMCASIVFYRAYLPVGMAFVIAYSTLVCAVVAASLNQRPTVIVAIVLFMASDVLLARNMIVDMTIPGHILSLGVYYLSMFILAASVWYGKKEEDKACDELITN